LPDKYVDLIHSLYRKNVINNDSKIELLDYLNTPSSDIDDLIGLESFNYDLIKKISEHVKAN